MPRLALAVIALAAAVQAPATAAPPPYVYAGAGPLTATGTLSGTSVHGPRELALTGSVTMAGTDGALVTYGCALSGTVTGGELGTGGWLTGACGPYDDALCMFLVHTVVKSEIHCSDGSGRDFFLGHGVFRPLDVASTRFEVAYSVARLAARY